MDCCTAKLGGHVRRFENGHIDGVWYNSCRHRSCRQCNRLHRARWLEKQKARLLEGAHGHIVFTIPHEFHARWRMNPPLRMALLFRAVRETLNELTADSKYLGAEPVFRLILSVRDVALSSSPARIHAKRRWPLRRVKRSNQRRSGDRIAVGVVSIGVCRLRLRARARRRLAI